MTAEERELTKLAFLYAHEVLCWLEDQGVTTAHAELFADGSGALVIGNKRQLTPAVKEILAAKLHSNRWTEDGPDKMILNSCQGWHR